MSYRPNDSQKLVISSTGHVVVVLGGAGTGKTTTAVAAARVHLEHADEHLTVKRRSAMLGGQRTKMSPPQRVLFLSFSRTAVAQIIDRAATVIGTYGPRLEVATFDGFAWRVINDFGARHGYPPPQSVLGAANSRVPGAPPGLTYRQLIPAAVQLLALPTVGAHYAGRYGLVICDEFQDTSTVEWQFLQMIAPGARRILLGDENQCIYTFKGGVDPTTRVAAALALPGSKLVRLPPASYRDPTQVLPAAANAARERRFDDPAIAAASQAGRLAITRFNNGAGYEQVIALTRQARQLKQTVSIFTHTIAATTALADALTTAGLAHEQIGFGEAFGEALPAQLALIKFALGDTNAPFYRTLAVYITATLGGKESSPPPPLARQMLDRSNPQLEHALNQLATDLLQAGNQPLDNTRLADVVSGAYARIGTYRGQDTWTRAAQRTRTALRLLDSGNTIDAVAAELMRVRDDSLVGTANDRRRSIQVMNLHQTKGREADATILLLGPEEWYGGEGEPFTDNSRLLYVVMTRARHHAHVVVPTSPHALWQPLVSACEWYAQLTR